MSLANYLETALVAAVCNADSAFGVDEVWIQLHTGDPGENCDNNIAGNTERQQVTFDPAAGGSASSDSDVVWTDVSTTETYTDASLWDAETDGNPLWYGSFAESKAVNAGDTFTLAGGTVTAALN